jgi:Repeat of unknown function (DUF346)
MRERAVSVVGMSPGALFAVFGCAAEGHELLCKIWDGTQPVGEQWLPPQEGWTSLGGVFESTIAPVPVGGLFPPWPQDLFGLGSNFGMYHGILTVPTPLGPPAPVGWSAIGGAFNGPPAASQYGAGPPLYAPDMDRIVVGLGTDNQPYASSYSAITQEFSGWLPLGGVLISELAYDTSGPDDNRFAILGVGTDAQLYRLDIDATNWPPALSGWAPLGGCFRASPAAVSWGPGRLDVFGLGNNLGMYHRAWVNGAAGAEWQPLGGTFDSSPAVVSWGQNRLDIFGLGTDDSLYHKAWDGNQWLPSASWEPLGGKFVSAPTAISAGPNRLDIFGLGTDQSMYHKAWDGNQWLPSAVGWESLGGAFVVPRSTVMPTRQDFGAHITFPGSTAAEGNIHVTMFSDGRYEFTGDMHDSGAAAYDFAVACAVIDSKNREYTFSQSGYIAGTFEPGKRDAPWDQSGINGKIADFWDDLFGCGGAQFKWAVATNPDVVGLVATLILPGVLEVIDVVSK